MLSYYSDKYSFSISGRSTTLVYTTRVTLILLLLLLVYLHNTHLWVSGERVLGNDYSQQREIIDQRRFSGGYVVCPDRCSCSKETKNGITIHVDCSRANYTNIPSDIPSDVTNLDLSQNKLSQLRANSFSRLTSLKTLTLSANIITRIDVNAFAGLTHLRELVLNKNQIKSSGLVDFVFSSLRSLTNLQLWGCGLESINIKAFLNLTNLAFLDFRSNQLTAVPQLMHNKLLVFPNLKTLRLDYNQIQSISLKQISSLSSLEFINLIGNHVSELCSPDSTKQSTRSEDGIINRSNNKSSSLGNLLDEDVYIGQQLNNEGTHRPQSPSRLTKLFLSSNLIRDLSANCFRDVTSLKRLVIANNRIRYIDPLAFQGLIFLTELILSGNSMLVYEDFIFSAASSLKILDLEHAQMTTFNIRALLNLTNLHTLILSKNYFTYIPNVSQDSISVAPNLKVLLIAHNKIKLINEADPTQDGIQYTENICNITELHLDQNLIEFLPENSFKRFPLLRVLTLAFNFITKIDSATFTGLENLNHLDLSQNRIKFLLDGTFSPLHALFNLYIINSELGKQLNTKAFLNLTNLQELHLDNNKLEDVPIFTDKSNASILPNLMSLSMSSNNLIDSNLVGLTTLPSLQTVTLDNNNVTLYAGIIERLPKLRELRMIKCRIVVLINGLKSRSLTQVIMNGSYFRLLPRETFEDASMLRILHMSKSQQSDHSKKQQTFRNMAHLEILDLSDTGIIPNENTLKNSTRIKYLNLNGNALGKQLNRHLFHQMTNLESLHLRSTGLVSVNFTFLPENVWNKLIEIDFSLNPYSCECDDIVWFRNWLQETNTTILNSNAYTCQYPEKQRGKHIQVLLDPSNLSCFMTGIDRYSVSIFTFLFVFFISSLLVFLLYRFRWHVRYWQSLFLTTRRRYRELSQHGVYEYDAFVMFSQEDLHWVIHELRPHIENKEHLRLCIHHRDWLAGQDITDNITESIENSRKCLLIVSNAFAASQWCHFELTMAQSRLFQGDRDNLVLVVLEEISECHVTPRLRLQMQRQTYIEWTDNVLGQQLFWARLARALRGPDQSVINTPLPQSVFVDANQPDNIEEE